MTRTHSQGFSLIELMAALAVGAILLVIAVPSYLQSIRESRRAEAKTALLDLAGREETLFSTTNAYSNVPAAVGYGNGAFPLAVGSDYYTVNVAVPNPAAPAATPSFLLTATPVAGSSQANDAPCQSFTVDQLGNQKAYNSGGVDNSTTCWGS
ncbi:MAG TPA: type IV pilin protein [Steroidobacteraceae bacterium]|jgi:type IV pilus assembly protein PilE